MLEYVNLLAAGMVKCGSLDFEIPAAVFNLVHYVILIIQIIVPILLIIWGMLDFAKGLVKGKDEDIKAGQKTFISRLIVAVIVFLVVTVVTLVIDLVGKVAPTQGNSSNDQSISNCMKCFVNGTDASGNCKE